MFNDENFNKHRLQVGSGHLAKGWTTWQLFIPYQKRNNEWTVRQEDQCGPENVWKFSFLLGETKQNQSGRQVETVSSHHRQCGSFNNPGSCLLITQHLHLREKNFHEIYDSADYQHLMLMVKWGLGKHLMQQSAFRNL